MVLFLSIEIASTSTARFAEHAVPLFVIRDLKRRLSPVSGWKA
jgi:hypothetical protein